MFNDRKSEEEKKLTNKKIFKNMYVKFINLLGKTEQLLNAYDKQLN